MIVAIVFLGAYAWQVIGNLQGRSGAVAELVIWATWAVFTIDYLANLFLAPHRWEWFRRNIFSLLVVVLPVLRPLRLLRLVTILSVLQRTAGTAFRERVVVYVAGASALLVFIAALAVLDAERSATGASITTFGDAIWWAFVTITTVGYGDFSPVTLLGRLIAAGLMLGGVALLGVVTATLASWIVERVSKQEEDSQSATRGEVKALGRQLELMRATLDKQSERED
jgi:voltage-gated potassium channel